MKTSSIIVMVFGLIATSVLGAEKKQDTADHLQNVSVTIRSEGEAQISFVYKQRR